MARQREVLERRGLCNVRTVVEPPKWGADPQGLDEFEYLRYSKTVGISNRRSRVEQTEENRRRILEAARAVFVARGYHATTLDQIAEQAGFTKGAVFSRFASKAELFFELYDARITERVAAIQALPRARGVKTTEAMVRQWLARLRGDEAWSLLVLEFRLEAARDPALLARYRTLYERLVLGVAVGVARDTEAAGIALPMTPVEVAHLGLALANGLLMERLAAPKAVRDELVLQADRALFAGISGTPGRKPR
jgi:AcrR family transcriptional regulator